jgi:hypothetical protein
MRKLGTAQRDSLLGGLEALQQKSGRRCKIEVAGVSLRVGLLRWIVHSLLSLPDYDCSHDYDVLPHPSSPLPADCTKHTPP